MFESAQLLLWVVGQVVVGAAIWGGIRSDLRAMHREIDLAQKTADEAHHRIDNLLYRGDPR